MAGAWNTQPWTLAREPYCLWWRNRLPLYARIEQEAAEWFRLHPPSV